MDLTHELRRANHPCPADKLNSPGSGAPQSTRTGFGSTAAGQDVIDQNDCPSVHPIPIGNGKGARNGGPALVVVEALERPGALDPTKQHGVRRYLPALAQ